MTADILQYVEKHVGNPTVCDHIIAEIVRLRGEVSKWQGLAEAGVTLAENQHRREQRAAAREAIAPAEAKGDFEKAVDWVSKDPYFADPQPADGEAVADAWKTVHVLMSVMRFRPLATSEQDDLHKAHVTIRTAPPAAQVQQPEQYAEGPTWTHNGQRISLVNGQLVITRNGKIEFIGATHPATGDKVRELVEKWRPHGRVPVCELEAALAQPQEAGRG